MKIRLIYGFCTGVYPDDFFIENANKIYNGQLVNDWITTDVIPTAEQIRLGYKFIDGVWTDIRTPEEIAYVPVPQSISLLKLRMQLIIMEINLNNVQMVIDGITDPLQKALTNERWKNAVSFDRDNLMLNQLATVLGLTQNQIDDIFINGNKLD